MIDWIDTNGPPLCGTTDIAGSWRGTDGTSVGQEKSDYARACAVDAYLGKIVCGSGEVLLLGDEPLRSAFYLASQTLIIARWWSCESADRANRALREIPPQLPSIDDGVRFTALTSALVMFDAARQGSEPGNLRRATIAPGAYSVSSENYEVLGTFKFIVHRFRPISEGRIK